MKILPALAISVLLAGCGTALRQAPAPEPAAPEARARPAPAPAEQQRRGAYYKDDGPGDNAPPNLEQIPDAEPRAEPPHRFANRPYEVFGRQYVPLAKSERFRERGLASWYGRRYHGQRTSSGEPYDMYAMTAAHPTLPIPSYVRVTSVANGRSVIVRVNDRGPFHAARIIDLSYTAALKLGYVDAGSTQVEVESVIPGGAAPVAVPPVATAPVPVRQPPASPQSAERKGVFLQLGAFSGRDNAESFRARIYRDLTWLNDAIHVLPGGGLFRLQLGPYASVDDARRVADRIRADLSLAPVVVAR